MAKRNCVVVLSSEDEDGSNTRSLSFNRTKPKPRTRSTSSRGKKRARVSGSGPRLSKLYEINLYDDDFNEVFTGSKVLKGAMQRSYGLINTGPILWKSLLFTRKRLKKLRSGLRKG